MKRAVILYAVYSGYSNANFFLQNALINSDSYDFVIINSNENITINIDAKHTKVK